jgi:hypothetical protein
VGAPPWKPIEAKESETMPNWDAQIKLLFPADDSTTFTADTVPLNTPFDALASVEVGQGVMGFAVGDELTVVVRNLSQSTTLITVSKPRTLTPSATALNDNIKVDIPATWTGTTLPGDVLELVATYRMDAGIYTDYSSTKSETFIAVK